MTRSPRITPVLLSGGTGSRLWPLSREAYPKQLLPLVETGTMLQQTAQRTLDAARFDAPLVVCNEEHRFIIGEQLRALGLEDTRIILEPEGRNTAPAVAVAALCAASGDPDAVILVMPADHVIRDTAGFLAAVQDGAAAAAEGRYVLFGIRPTEAATGYGYIRIGAELAEAPGAHEVAAFVEKPDFATATRYLDSGEYLWNGGIFLLPVRPLLEEFAETAPDVLAAARAALGDARRDIDFIRLDAAAFAKSPSISLDHAVMEHTKRATVVPVDIGWTDVGSWSALWEIGDRDPAGNVVSGDVLVEDVKSSYLRSEGPLVAALGVEDLIIVATSDAVLVTRKDRDQDVKRIVERLKAEGREAATQSPQVHRPWGFYQSIHTGERFQVKRITVKPGEKLSLQKHFHRAEHWVVVNGTALVTRDGEEILLRENESIFLPLGCIHRLANPGRVPLNLIEVQSGPYLGEDDIVRIEDIYART
jgi:mannose-1-phosphate guanylyltransferase/mannose-6-phosphate isomerase